VEPCDGVPPESFSGNISQYVCAARGEQEMEISASVVFPFELGKLQYCCSGRGISIRRRLEERGSLASSSGVFPSGVPNEAPYGREPQPSFKLSPGPSFTLTVAQASAAPIVGPGVSIKTSSLSTAMPSLCLFPSAEPIVDCSFERVSSQHYRTPSSLLSTVPSIGLKPSSFAT
jgi:hypothetical protein